MRQQGVRRGMAIIVVLVMSLAFLSLAGILFFYTGSQRVSHENLVKQTKAMMAAKAAVQLAVYKYRVLPREFYLYQDALKPGPLVTVGLPPPASADVVDAWMGDLSSQNGGVFASLAARLAAVDPEGGTYQMRVTKFDLISKASQGYQQDFLRIEAWGDYDGDRKTIEEFVEIQVTHP